MLIKPLLICSSLVFLLASRASANGILSNSANNNNSNRNSRQQRTNERGTSSSSNISSSNNKRNNNLKSAISDLIQGYTSGQSTRVGQQSSRLAKGIAKSVAVSPVAMSLVFTPKEYECAQYCSCSLVQVVEQAEFGSSNSDRKVNLTQAKCESSQFTDLLTIDRRTQIIHISLPLENLSSSSSVDEDPLSSSSTSPDSSSAATADETPFTGEVPNTSTQLTSFRMPRLVQFNLLREIRIINLRFEVCDSEVFKKGQRLRRLQLNHNHLTRISKACLKHLDRLIELNLDHNKLEELESALFNNLLSLRFLSVAHNSLTDLAAHQFANLSELVSLNLVGNSFKSINLHLFEPMQSSLKLLLLGSNKIKSFLHSPLVHSTVNSNQTPLKPTGSSQQPFQGVVFRQLVKLNVDNNKIERIKLLQLHRFFNVKFLSIRHNNIAAIRDKAFNGLKLSELNLAHNQLSSISRCAFCNATVKRLVLAHNNISLSQVVAGVPASSASSSTATTSLTNLGRTELPARPLPPLNDTSAGGEASTVGGAAAPTHNMVILSQSVVGPLFNQLEYLDVSSNERLGEQLDLLLEPLLKLEYLNLANVGLDPYLPSPSLFKNLRQLRYLNLSHNQLDQLLAESIEPLQQLELLDLSHNKFSELDESLLVVIDELPLLKLVKLSENPWYCSQCKVAPLYDWILRSPIYNQTCIAPASNNNSPGSEQFQQAPGSSVEFASGEQNDEYQATTYTTQPRDYGLLLKRDDQHLISGERSLSGTGNELFIAADITAYEGNSYFEEDPALISLLLAGGSIEGSDNSLVETMLIMERLSTNYLSQTYSASEYCVRCEFPGELKSFAIHELSASDFKFCAGAAPRFSASEPKIGLTLAIVIIGALFCIIIVVIVIYRRKSSAYYPNEFDPDEITGASGGGVETGGVGKRPIFSVSSDADGRGYGDATDYSSPPMSQSSYSAGPDEDLADEDEEFVDEDEQEEEEEEEEDDDDDDDEEEMGMEDEEEEEEDEEIKQAEEGVQEQVVVVERQVAGHSAESGAHQELERNSSIGKEVKEHHPKQNEKLDQQERANTLTSGSKSQSLSEHSSSGATSHGQSARSMSRMDHRQTHRQVSTSAAMTEDTGTIITTTTTVHTRLPPVKRASSSRASSGSLARLDGSQRASMEQVGVAQQRTGAMVIPAALESAQQQVAAAAAATTVAVVPQAARRANTSGLAGSSIKPADHQLARQTSNQKVHSTEHHYQQQQQQQPHKGLNPPSSGAISPEGTRHIPLSRQRFAVSKDVQKSQPLGTAADWLMAERKQQQESVEEDEHEMATRGHPMGLPSPSSEATSADSLVIELDMASFEDVDELAPSPNGGALEGVASSPDEQPEEHQHHHQQTRHSNEAQISLTRRKHQRSTGGQQGHHHHHHQQQQQQQQNNRVGQHHQEAGRKVVSKKSSASLSHGVEQNN